MVFFVFEGNPPCRPGGSHYDGNIINTIESIITMNQEDPTNKTYPGVAYVQDTAALLLGHDNFTLEHGIDEGGLFIQLKVPKEDLGRVIGKAGSTANSIRCILRAMSIHSTARYNLKIDSIEPSQS